MGDYVFDNQPFDSWLNKKSDEILSKVDKERITTEEMIILVLKAQTNHFEHMDVDLKKGMSVIRKSLEKQDEHITAIGHRLDQNIDRLDQKIDSRFMWMVGITIAMSGGIYLKLFLG
jgi:hypothetical protein